MRNAKLRETIGKVSEGILSNLTDILLWELAYLSESMVTFDRTTWKARIKADKFLEEVNYESIKKAIERAKRDGFIKTEKAKNAWPQITAVGKRRLESLIPRYDEKRIWDKRVHLITYDIPEKIRRKRTTLQWCLKKIGCGMMQDSVWMTPFDPRDVLKDFIYENKLAGNIIISDIGENGSIGDEDLKTTVRRIYHLDKLNKEYDEFIHSYSGLDKADRLQIIFKFLSILKNDPQLPFELLPDDWVGDIAYKIYQKVNQFKSENQKPKPHFKIVYT